MFEDINNRFASPTPPTPVPQDGKDRAHDDKPWDKQKKSAEKGSDIPSFQTPGVEDMFDPKSQEQPPFPKKEPFEGGIQKNLEDQTGISKPFSSETSNHLPPHTAQALPSLKRQKMFLLVGIILVGALVVGAGGYLAYQQFFLSSRPSAEEGIGQKQDQQEQDKRLSGDAQETADGEKTPADAPQEPADGILSDEDGAVSEFPEDSDGDGLTDDEERQYGTDPLLADSDRDGLFDREEVVTWGTDPLNPDSDGDGYIDGDEVKNGYDPLGPGRLEYYNFILDEGNGVK